MRIDEGCMRLGWQCQTARLIIPLDLVSYLTFDILNSVSDPRHCRERGGEHMPALAADMSLRISTLFCSQMDPSWIAEQPPLQQLLTND